MVEVDLVGVCFPKVDVDVVSLTDTESTTVGINSTYIGSTETREAKGEVG